MNGLDDSDRKSLFPRGPALGLRFLLLASLSIGMMLADHRGDTRLALVRQWTARMLQPLVWTVSLPGATTGLGDHFRSRQSLIEENADLRHTELELQGRVLRMEALEAENERIRELLSSAASLQTRVLIAEVLKLITQDPYRHQIMLNKGERDGVYKGQALVDADGIMGQVIQVNSASSIALLINDPDNAVPVEVNRTGLQTIALGRGEGQALSLPYLPGNADVKVGDLLVSSGLGERFPSGYPVGKISELRHPAGEAFMEGIAYPTAKLNQGRQVLLVWSERAAAPAAPAAPDSAAVPTDLPQSSDAPVKTAADTAGKLPQVASKHPADGAAKPAPAPAGKAVAKPSDKPPISAAPKPAVKPGVKPAARPANAVASPAAQPAAEAAPPPAASPMDHPR